MIGSEPAPGVWRWITYHQEWQEDVGSVALLRDQRLVLVDPLLSAEQWDQVALPPGAELDVVLTIHWHARSAAEVLARRPGARVWAQAANAAAIRRRTPVTDLFRPGDALPGGLQAYVVRPRSEVVLFDPSARALIAGDALIGDDAGGLTMCPGSWLPHSTTIEQLRQNLEPLLELPLEVVLVSHGEPVLSGARAALERALAV